MPNLPALPPRIAKLPTDHRGYPVPWFVQYINGVPDFRIMDAEKRARAVKQSLCWVCGDRLGVHKAFVIGPMCAVNRVSSEPPSHLDCAKFAATACPFLTKPRMRRNEKDLPDEHHAPGVALRRNPGVALVWVTRSYKTFAADNGWLIKVGDPTMLIWFAEGRPAQRAEIMASIESGLPLLRDMAAQDGTDAVALLEKQIETALKLVPKEPG